MSPGARNAVVLFLAAWVIALTAALGGSDVGQLTAICVSVTALLVVLIHGDPYGGP